MLQLRTTAEAKDFIEGCVLGVQDYAYNTAERKAKQEEVKYHNPYNQLVEWRFLEAIDAFEFDDELKSGTEVYSRFIRITKGVSIDTFMKSFYPETEFIRL